MKRRDLIAVIFNVNDAINEVLQNWEGGDLATAVRELAAVQREVKAAIEWWESDED